MIRLAWAELRLHPSRYLATAAATAIAVGFVVALLVFVPTQARSIAAGLTASVAGSDLVVSGVEDADHSFAERLRAVPGVAYVDSQYDGYADFATGTRAGGMSLTSLSGDDRLRWQQLASGRWPTRTDELLISRTTAAAYDLAPGDTVTFGAVDSGRNRTMSVVGVATETNSLFEGGQATGYVVADFFSGVQRTYPEFLLITEPGVAPETVRDAIGALLPADALARTTTQIGDEALAQVSNDVQVAMMMLLVFGAIALLVGGMIVANTQVILLTQRRRQIGLVRAVGAGRGQVRRSLLAESGLVSALGSAAGLGLGLVAAAVGVELVGGPDVGLVVPWAQVTVAGLSGVVVAVTASLLPVRRATRVPPVEALRPVADATRERRVGRLQVVAGLALVTVGGLGVVAARQVGQTFLVTVAACLVLALGVLVLAPGYLPLLLRGVGALAGRLGPTVRLAAANLIRQPRRTAATATALMLAVGLIVTLQVGAASVKRSVDAEVGRQFPVDVMLSDASGGTLDPTLAGAVAAVPGVLAVEEVRQTQAVMSPPGGDAEMTVAGLAPSADRVVAGGFETVAPGVILAHHFTIEGWQLTEGQEVTLIHGSRRVTGRLVASDIADAGQLVVPQAVLDQLDPTAPVERLWVRTSHDDPARVVADIEQVAARQVGLAISGSLVEAAGIGAAVDAVLLVATGLLAVAVLIALIGVGNTVSLSVLERTRESALLRALGVQRRQLRGMLAVEASLLAVVATVVGVLAGLGFGILGTYAISAEAELGTPLLAVDVPQTALVVAVALAAGLLASILPGRRAARAMPAAALADE